MKNNFLYYLISAIVLIALIGISYAIALGYITPLLKILLPIIMLYGCGYWSYGLIKNISDCSGIFDLYCIILICIITVFMYTSTIFYFMR